MTVNLGSNAVVAGLVTGLAVLGCETALTITGHMGADIVAATGTLLIGGGTGILGSHVGATAATTAASSASPTPDQTSAPSPGPAAPAPGATV